MEPGRVLGCLVAYGETGRGWNFLSGVDMKKPPFPMVLIFVPCNRHISFCSGSRVNRGTGHGTWSYDFTAGLGSGDRIDAVRLALGWAKRTSRLES